MSAADAKKALKAQDDARKAAMTEAERIQAEATEAAAKAATATATAAQTAHDARVQIALVRAGVHPDKLEWAARAQQPAGQPPAPEADARREVEGCGADRGAVPEPGPKAWR
jgi:hypothetical protein